MVQKGLEKMQPICKEENYEIYFSSNSVLACSKKRIAFSPRGWQKEFRKRLRCALLQLYSAENQCLTAYCHTVKDGFFDLENILFYNIGAHSFRETAKNQVSAALVSSHEDFVAVDNGAFPHIYLYKIMDSASAVDLQATRDTAVDWEPVPVSKGFRGEKKPFYYWEALTQDSSKIHQHYAIQPGKPFAINVCLSIPESETINLTGVMKPLLDGIVCAFHGPDSRLAADAEEIGKRLGITKDRLLHSTTNVLGETCFVKLNQNQKSVRWNPQDYRCESFTLSVEHNPCGIYSFSGRIDTL